MTWLRARVRFDRLRGWLLSAAPLLVVALMQCSGKGGGSGY